MTTEERRALLDRAITTYGAPAQMDMAVEEMAELTKALCKVKRVSCAAEAKAALENAVEEMADVQIMLDQLRIIFGRSTAEAEEYKLERLKKRLDAATAAEASHRKEPSSDPDAEIPTPAAPVTQYGDLWILGRHRVLCGDCTRPEDRALLLDGNKPEILLTDPPYCSGGSKESQKSTGSIGTERKNGKAPKIANDILSTRGYQNLIRGALTDIPCLYAYIFTDWRMWVYLFDLVEAAGFGVKSEIVWDKGTPGMGVGWRSQHELILFGAKAATHFDGHKGYGNVLSISRSGNELHPTQKPVELLEKLVDNTDFATGVYDPFGGSGTTLAACEAYGQPSYIMELTPAFTDVIVKRYIRITGKTTVRCVRQGRELPREEIAAIFEPDEEGDEQE